MMSCISFKIDMKIISKSFIYENKSSMKIDVDLNDLVIE